MPFAPEAARLKSPPAKHDMSLWVGPDQRLRGKTAAALNALSTIYRGSYGIRSLANQDHVEDTGGRLIRRGIDAKRQSRSDDARVKHHAVFQVLDDIVDYLYAEPVAWNVRTKRVYVDPCLVNLVIAPAVKIDGEIDVGVTLAFYAEGQTGGAIGRRLTGREFHVARVDRLRRISAGIPTKSPNVFRQAVSEDPDLGVVDPDEVANRNIEQRRGLAEERYFGV